MLRHDLLAFHPAGWGLDPFVPVTGRCSQSTWQGHHSEAATVLAEPPTVHGTLKVPCLRDPFRLWVLVVGWEVLMVGHSHF